VRVFHSPVDALRGYASGPGAVPFPVLGDPGREVYRRYGVGGSLRSLFSLFRGGVRERFRLARASGLHSRFRDALRDGIGGNPADFLIGPDGRLLQVRYGEHLADSVPVAAALAWIDAAERPGRERTAPG
jgi:peroxiredoxin